MALGDGIVDPSGTEAKRGLRVVAKSLFKELKRAGYGQNEMVAFAGELLALVTQEIRTREVDASDDVS